jgi:hypothetical protein
LRYATRKSRHFNDEDSVFVRFDDDTVLQDMTSEGELGFDGVMLGWIAASILASWPAPVKGSGTAL